MIKKETTKFEICGRQYEYFMSVHIQKAFAKKYAEIEQKGEEAGIEMLEFTANLLVQGIKNAAMSKGFLWRIFNRPPSVDYLMKTLSSEELMAILTGSEGENNDPNQ